MKPLITPALLICTFLLTCTPTSKVLAESEKRDWEKHPPVSDSDVIQYEAAQNIPLEQRFETQERLSMEAGYREDATLSILNLVAPTPNKQKELLNHCLQKIEEEEILPRHKTALTKQTLTLFSLAFPKTFLQTEPPVWLMPKKNNFKKEASKTK